jgi:hypothetical protein
MLTDKNMQKRMGAALLFLGHYHREDDEFLDHSIKGVETYAPESKRQSQE